MKHLASILIALALLLPTVAYSTVTSAQASVIPTFSIVSVVADDTVTIQTHNFPAGRTFTVRMGDYGTRGIGGIKVGTTDSGAGGAFQVTYNIPTALKGAYRIAIRLSSTGGYYAYNWFYNNTAGSDGGAPTGYSGIPTFSITAVVKDKTVSIKTYNFPAHQVFTVRMGAYGTLGIGGVKVTTTNSGEGGIFEKTYNIPASLKGSYRIAIRLESSAGYYAYNWFYNNTTNGSDGGNDGYSGIPTFSIAAVVHDKTVTIKTHNFPAHQTFTVRMGAYGSLGIGGVKVGTTDSGSGGSFEKTYNIPASLKGSSRIAIRLDGAGGYYAYNWFYNNTYP